MRPIPGYSDYLVTPDGRVFSFKGGDTTEKAQNDHQGYKRASLWRDGKRHKVFVHRLVAMTYLPNDEGKSFVLHKNDVKHDNRVENLYWGTKKQNRADAFRNGVAKMPNLKGEGHGQAKITEDDALEIRKRYNEGDITQKALAEEYGLTQQGVSDIINRRSWKHI